MPLPPGHTTILMIIAMTFFQYCRPSQLGIRATYTMSALMCGLVRRVVYLWTFVGVVTIVATRLHYTLDVTLAVYLVTRVWATYHHFAKVTVLKKRSAFMEWLEAEEIIALDQDAFEKWKGKSE